jgi:prefoldin beta subunit
MPEMSEDTKNLLIQFQTYQQQLQSVMIQKESMKLQVMEIERAMEELDKTKQATAYKITGNVMISRPVTELKKELDDTKEETDVRVKSLEKTEERLSTKLKELGEKLKVIKEDKE